MTLKAKFFLFIIIIHVLLGVLLFKVIEEPRILFLLAELGILISLFLSFQIYLGFIKPLTFISSGIDALRDKDFNVKFLPSNSKEMNRLISVYNDMIDNIRQERTHLEEQHYFLQKLIQASPNGILILDHDDQITEINPQAYRILGISLNFSIKQIMEQHRDLLNQITQIQIGAAQVISIAGADKVKVEVAHFIHRGFKRKFILIQELSKEILEAEKAAYSKVIRMMAHEVNNSIGAVNSILSSTVEIYEEQEHDPDVKEALLIAIDRNQKLNQFMKNFAKVVRLPPPKKSIVSLTNVIYSIAGLMESQAQASNIQFKFDLSDHHVKAHIDEKQIEQVLVNIVKNAIESIGENGVIQFKLNHKTELEIWDNGKGIDEDAVPFLFSPFFSTKVDGQGVGLTLVKEILINHHASFSLKTRQSGWTVFKIQFKASNLISTPSPVLQQN